MLHGPKIFSFYFGLHILNFLSSSHKSAKETTRSILKQLTFAATRRAACPDEFPMCPQRNAPHRIGVSRPLD